MNFVQKHKTKLVILLLAVVIPTAYFKWFKENPSDILRFYIKDGNFAKFKENFERNKSLIETN